MDTLLEYYRKSIESFPTLVAFTLTIIAALTILIVGIFVARSSRKILRKPSFAGGRLDPTLRPVIASVVFYVIIAMTLYAFLTKLGVPSNALLAVFGSAGLAIGLALKDTLSNIAAGVMMLTLRPLKVGEFIDTPQAAGTVDEIGLFATTLKNTEGIYIYVPNGQMWNSRVQNFGRHTQRKLTVDIGVAYDTDLAKAKVLLLDVMRNNPNVINTPTEPECYVMTMGESSVVISSRCWLPAPNWLAQASDMRIALKEALDKDGIEIPFPQHVVKVVKP